MTRITISEEAADKLSGDPQFHQWREGKSLNEPFLSYFRRSYATLHDGTVIEHGDGFMLTFMNPDEARETKGIVLKTVALADGLDVLVGASESIMSSSFTIGWSKWKFTYEPEASS